MPPAVALAIPAIAGAGASASSGKKGANSAKDAANRQFGMQQSLFNTGLSAWQPAADYFKKLLSGDPTQIAQAVGPTSDILKGQAQGQSRQLAATLPSGGEANAAQATNAQGSYNNLARLYAGVQPGAASALGQLSAAPLGASAPNVGSGLKFDTHQQEQLGQSKGTIGSGLGTVAANAKHGSGSSGKGSGGGGKSSPSPIAAGDPSICWIAQALYGDNDPRVITIRNYLTGRFSRYRVGWTIVLLYKTFGERIARYQWITELMRPLFNLALRRAYQ